MDNSNILKQNNNNSKIKMDMEDNLLIILRWEWFRSSSR